MSSLFDAIEKPTLLLDEAAARKNIARIAAKARSAGVAFRPHFKTHQSAAFGEWFRSEGVQAITVSSVDMAEYFASNGWTDILIAFPANVRQAAAISNLARRVRLGLLVESMDSVRALAAALAYPADIWLKVDAGSHRTGLRWDNLPAVMEVVRAVESCQHMRLRGLLTHAGHTYSAADTSEVLHRFQESTARLDRLRHTLQNEGIGPLMVSVGDTPSASLSSNFGAADEIRPGNFIFYDAQQLQLGSCGSQDIAVALACPIVANHPDRNQVVVYGGAVHLSKDFVSHADQRSYGLVCLPQEDGWGAPIEGAYVSALSQEHGILHIPPEAAVRFPIGGLACILPAHSCLTVTLMKRYRTLSGETIDTMNIEGNCNDANNDSIL